MLEYSHVTSSLIDVGHVLDQRPQGVPLPLILELLVGIFHLGDDEHDDTYIYMYSVEDLDEFFPNPAVF